MTSTTTTLRLTPLARPARATRLIELTVDGQQVRVPEGATILHACEALAINTPTLCYLQTLTPVNACRVCVVELEGSRTLVPACSRVAEAGMVVHTDSPRVRTSRRLVLEFLGSSVDFSAAPTSTRDYFTRYEAHPERFGQPALDDEDVRDSAHAGHHHPVADGLAATVAQPVKRDNELYLRDYAKCILCYKCVEACGDDAQNTFAISAAGRGFDARISTEFATPLPDSACVYCGNCISVCPTGALMFTSEYDLRAAGEWREETQTITDTICPYCGVGCTLQLHVQDNRIVKVTSPIDHDVTSGHLCVKGRFGWQHVQNDADGGRGGHGHDDASSN